MGQFHRTLFSIVIVDNIDHDIGSTCCCFAICTASCVISAAKSKSEELMCLLDTSIQACFTKQEKE